MLDDAVLERGGAEPRVPQAQQPLLEREATARAPAPQAPASEGPASLSPADAQPHVATKPSQKGFLRRRPVVSAIGALLLASALGGGYLYLNQIEHFQSTDDAFIAARQSSLAPKVSGYITAVPVTDNQHVAAGDVIARIDDRDYRTALEQAEAQVAAAQASVDNITAQIQVQQAQVAQNQSQIAQAQASLTFDQEQEVRYQELARTGAGTVQSAQQWLSQRQQQQATLKAAEATLVATVRQLTVLNAQRDAAEANLRQAMAQRDQAKLNLSYTTVVAAQPGRVVQLSAAVGEYAQAGTALTMFVPDDIWVDANFKENQLDQMRPGQAVTLHIDAYPEDTVHGHVASVQPGSGTAFSLLPAENATGNYVKIVQRVPVKIVLDNPPADVALGPGMSVEPTVRVDPSPSLAQRLESVL
jgi:membrane fusion protein (multidrug efflux system)